MYELNLIKTRLLEGEERDKQRVIERLEAYREILRHGKIDFDENQPAHQDLLNIRNLIQKRNGKLIIRYPIYGQSLNETWVDKQLNRINPKIAIQVINTYNKEETNSPSENTQPNIMTSNPNNSGNDNSKGLINRLIETVSAIILIPLFQVSFLPKILDWLSINFGINEYIVMTIIFIIIILLLILKYYKQIISFLDKYKIEILIILFIFSFITIVLFKTIIQDIKVDRINYIANASDKIFRTEQIKGLKKAIISSQELQEIVEANQKFIEYPTIKPVYALHKAVNEIYELNQVEASSPIRTILFNPEGDKIAFAEGKSLNIYDLKDTKIKKLQSREFNQSISSFNFSKTEKLIAVGFKNGEVKILDASLQQVKSRKRNAHNSEISSISFSKDGLKLLTTGKNGFVKLWDLSPDGKSISDEPAFSAKHGQFGLSASFSPDENYIATAGEIDAIHEKIKLWNSESGTSIGSILTDHTKIHSISFSHDGKYIATAGDNSVRIWNTNSKSNTTGEPKPELDIPANGVRQVSFSHWNDLELIVAVGDDRKIRIWQISNDNFSNDNSQQKLSSELLIELNAHKDKISTLALTKEKKEEPYYLATGGQDKKLHIWKYFPQRHMLVNQPEDMGALKKIDVGLSEQQLRIVTLEKNGKALIWDFNNQISNPNNTIVNNLNDVEKVALSNDKKLLAVIRENGEGEFYNLSGELQNSFEIPLQKITSLTFHPDGRVLATAGKYNNKDRVYIWNKSGAEARNNYFDTGIYEQINYLKYSPDANYLAMITNNHRLKVFSSIGGWHDIYTSSTNEKVTTFSFASKNNKTYIITGQRNSKISLWKLDKENLIKIDINQWDNNIHNGQINTVIFNDDGDYIASLDDDGIAKLWRLKDINSRRAKIEKIKLDWKNQTSPKITSLTFSPSYKFGQLIAGGDKKGKIHIWDMKGRKIAEFKPEGEEDKITEVTDIIFTPKRNDSENLIVAAYKNGIVRSWEVRELNDLINKGCQFLENYFSNHPEEKNKLGCPSFIDSYYYNKTSH